MIGIARLQQITGVTARALRYYEAAGLITACRTSTGARVFTPAQVDRAQAIVRLRRAGVGVKTLRDIADPARPETDRAAMVRRALQLRATDLERRLGETRALIDMLGGPSATFSLT